LDLAGLKMALALSAFSALLVGDVGCIVGGVFGALFILILEMKKPERRRPFGLQVVGVDRLGRLADD
jgi:hypothetical protein